ncbi:MAG: RloB family protein [Phycisphaerales bacterium JB064]
MARGRGGRSNRPPRSRRRVWLVSTEDTGSARTYISALARLHDTVHLRQILRAPNRTDPIGVVERIENEVAAMRRARDPRPQRAWAIIDAEPHLGAHHRRAIDAALERAKQLGVTVLIANPCFEYWLHLHIKDPGCDFDDPAEMKAALCASWKEDKQPGTYTKGGADLGRLVTPERIASAAGLARQRHLQGPRNGQPPHLCGPCCTDLYRLIDALQAPGKPAR